MNIRISMETEVKISVSLVRAPWLARDETLGPNNSRLLVK